MQGQTQIPRFGTSKYIPYVAKHDTVDLKYKRLNVVVYRTMMNLSIITTALPSLGRLVIELQPSIHAFTINEDPSDPRPPGTGYNFSSMGKSAADHDFKHGTSTQVTTGWRESLKDDGESTEGLVTGADQQNVIQQTIHFEVH
jgi:hypothetical protein